VAVFECSAARAAAAAEAAAAAAAELAAAEAEAAESSRRREPDSPHPGSQPPGELARGRGAPATLRAPGGTGLGVQARVAQQPPRPPPFCPPKGGPATEGRPIWSRASSVGPRAARRPPPWPPGLGRIAF